MRKQLQRTISGACLGLLMFVLSISASAQSVKDSGIAFPIIGVQYSLDLPVGQLLKSFGINSTIGASFWYKTSSNWLFGAEYNYIFGDVVNINPLDSINTSEGYLI